MKIILPGETTRLEPQRQVVYLLEHTTNASRIGAREGVKPQDLAGKVRVYIPQVAVSATMDVLRAEAGRVWYADRFNVENTEKDRQDGWLNVIQYTRMPVPEFMPILAQIHNVRKQQKQALRTLYTRFPGIPLIH